MSYDERALRRPDFQEDSVPIVLADNGTWYFPKPYLERIFPRVEKGRVVGMGSATHLGPEFDAVMARIDAVPGKIVYHDFFTVAALLLAHNYDLPDDAYPVLLDLVPDDEAGLDRIDEVLGVARGIGPKPSPAGGGSPASS